MELIDKITNEMKAGHLFQQPRRCAEYRSQLAGEYSFWAGQLEEILKKKPSIWNSARSNITFNFKSDKACDRWWEATPDGINETGISLKLKRIEKLMQGLSGLIKIAEGEARNQY